MPPFSQAMDVGIVFVIAVNAAVIGIAIDTPQHANVWEVVEIVPRPRISVAYSAPAGLHCANSSV